MFLIGMGFWFVPCFWLVWVSGMHLISDWYEILVSTWFLVGMRFWLVPGFWLVWDSGLYLVSDWYGILVCAWFLFGMGFWYAPGFWLVWDYVVGLYLVSGWSHWYTLHIEYSLCIVVCEDINYTSYRYFTVMYVWLLFNKLTIYLYFCLVVIII